MDKQLPLTDFIEYTPKQMQQRADDFLEQAKRRHSIRKFSKRAVSKQLIETCLLTAGSAPSGANHQPWHFVAISSPEIKAQIRQQAEQIEQGFYAGRAGQQWLEDLKPLGTNAHKPYLEDAPWLIAVFLQKKQKTQGAQDKNNYYVHESAGLATGLLIQSLHNAGLATLTHTPKPMSFLLDICQRDKDNERPFMLIVAGYPAVDATVPEHALKKKSIQELVSFL